MRMSCWDITEAGEYKHIYLICEMSMITSICWVNVRNGEGRTGRRRRKELSRTLETSSSPPASKQLADKSHQQLGRRAVCREAESKGTESSAPDPPSLRAVQEGRCPARRVSLWGPPGRKETNVSVRCSGNYPHPPAWPGH